MNMVIIMKIVKVGALWCPACLITNKSLNKIKEEYSDIEIIELDYDFDEEEVQKYNVGTVLPELILFKDDKEVMRLKGEKNYKELKNAVSEVL